MPHVHGKAVYQPRITRFYSPLLLVCCSGSAHGTQWKSRCSELHGRHETAQNFNGMMVDETLATRTFEVEDSH